MPKLKNQLPKLCKMGNYAIVNSQKKKTVLGNPLSFERVESFAKADCAGNTD